MTPIASARDDGTIAGAALLPPELAPAFDAPLGKSLRVTPGGASPASNDLGGYSILQAESKEALAETMKGHPHFMTPDGFIEIVDVMQIPGM